MRLNTDHRARCYALRRLNPFLGVLQVIETSRGRASTTNGVAWHIELLVERPPEWGSLGSTGEKSMAWYLYGLWSEKEGLVCKPSAVQTADHQSARDAEQIIALLQSRLHNIPFALADQRELWLLDKRRKKPLALLYAMQPGAEVPGPMPRYWTACLGRAGVGGQRRFPEIDRLHAAVRREAGFNLQHLWVNWDTKRVSVKSDSGENLNAADFPVFGIREDWPDRELQELVRRYIDWIAPSLLTLPYLQDVQRARLEASLSKQACSVEYHWRTYPKLLDPDKITEARVRARLQESTGGG